jgi:acyl-CoA reductase-like NAD-dependent aldehyde dehydrogenase
MGLIKKSSAKSKSTTARGNPKGSSLMKNKLSGVAKGATSLFGGSKGSGMGKRRHRKKSAMWYAKNIARIKLKRRYEHLLYRV